MKEYVFQGGNEIIKVRREPIKDWEISTKASGYKFIPMSSLIRQQKGEKGVKEYFEQLDKLFEDYLRLEFGKMGCKLVNKRDVS